IRRDESVTLIETGLEKGKGRSISLERQHPKILLHHSRFRTRAIKKEPSITRPTEGVLVLIGSKKEFFFAGSVGRFSVKIVCSFSIRTEHDVVAIGRPQRQLINAWAEREPRVRSSIDIEYPQGLICKIRGVASVNGASSIGRQTKV